VIGVAKRRAEALLAANVDAFRRLGYREKEEREELAARLEPVTPGRPALVLRMARQGRIFGGAYALEIASAEPLLPATAGLGARGRGVVRMSRVSFRARRGDAAGARLAARLGSDRQLFEAFRELHFERLRVEPDGRPVIRHMGGSVVWILFPPLVNSVPLVDAQATAAVAALEAFARLGALPGARCAAAPAVAAPPVPEGHVTGTDPRTCPDGP
jgi:Protein of unknown function (DUF3156)